MLSEKNTLDQHIARRVLYFSNEGHQDIRFLCFLLWKTFQGVLYEEEERDRMLPERYL